MQIASKQAPALDGILRRFAIDPPHWPLEREVTPGSAEKARAKKSYGDSPEAVLDLLSTMTLIRRFEEAVHQLFLRGDVHGTTHLCIGQEAVAAGVAAALEPVDWIAPTYRGHGHFLARGSDPQAYMDELFGRETGTSGGRAGSMNAVDLGSNIVGCYGIIGGALAAATGVSIALKRDGAGIAVGFLGDGAANQAYFHECLNFAKALSLPVVYVCENNGYGEYTPIHVTTPGGIAARPRALGIRTLEVDGQEAWLVRDVMRAARDHAIDHSEPVFIEARTYRYSDHGRGDPISYRPEGEMEEWKTRDPLLLARNKLVNELAQSQEAVDELMEQEASRVEEIVERALEAPYPDPTKCAWSEFATPLS